MTLLTTIFSNKPAFCQSRERRYLPLLVNVCDSVCDSVCDNVCDSVCYCVGNSVCECVCDSVCDCVCDLPSLRMLGYWFCMKEKVGVGVNSATRSDIPDNSTI